jgi:hypothetical protein
VKERQMRLRKNVSSNRIRLFRSFSEAMMGSNMIKNHASSGKIAYDVLSTEYWGDTLMSLFCFQRKHVLR